MGNQDAEARQKVLRTSQIATGGVAAGATIFVPIALLAGVGIKPLNDEAIMSMVMVAFAATVIVARVFVPAIIVNASYARIAQPSSSSVRQGGMQLPDTDEGRLLQVFLTKTIVAGAVLEGGAFGCLIALMLEGQIYTLVLAALLIVGILVGFPTRSGLDEWLETQQRRLAEYRDMHQ